MYIYIYLSLYLFLSNSFWTGHLRAYAFIIANNYAFVQLCTVQRNVAHTQCNMRIAAAAAATSSFEHSPVREIETTTRSYNGMLTSDANCCLARTTHTDDNCTPERMCATRIDFSETDTDYVLIDDMRYNAYFFCDIRIFMHKKNRVNRI